MAGTYTVIPQDTFDAMQLDAGVLLYNFDPANPAAPSDQDIICATTGGINPVCAPTYSDLGEDVDNVPVNMMELKHLDGWECTLAFTSLDTSPEGIRLALGAADVNATSGAITPRSKVELADFQDIWWVGDKADGGLVAIQLKNALSTDGFNLQTTKNGKGQTSCTLTGHVSINDQSTMPMVFYSLDAPTVTYTSATLTSAGFKYGVTYYTRSGAGTTENPYVYTKVAQNSVYDSSKTYYIKTYS